jgi:serine/threonine protein phosphatase PrpC
VETQDPFKITIAVMERKTSDRFLHVASRGHPEVYVIRGNSINSIAKEYNSKGIGTEKEDMSINISRTALSEGDVVVVASEGFLKLVKTDTIMETMLSSESPQIGCERLTRLAYKNGGGDNVTILAARA